MSIEHKAFLFAHESFQEELAGILEESLKSGQIAPLKEFIERNRTSVRDPYEGEALPNTWEEMVETKDAHQYGHFALTKYFNPVANIGLGYEWSEMESALEGIRPHSSAVLLGQAFGPDENLFDPGKMGTYFQNVKSLESGIRTLESLRSSSINPEYLELGRAMLKQALDNKQGLYVTF